MSLLKRVASDDSEKPTKQLSIRLKARLLDLLKAEADAAGVSVNELVSRLVVAASELPSFAPQAAESVVALTESSLSKEKIAEAATLAMQTATQRKLRVSSSAVHVEVLNVRSWPASCELAIEWKFSRASLRWTNVGEERETITANVDGTGTLLFAPSGLRLNDVRWSIESKVEAAVEAAEPNGGFIDDDLPF